MSMTVEDRATFRSVILPAEKLPSGYRVRELLSDLGHEVAPADTVDQAMDLLQHDQTDLLVIDVSNGNRNRELIDRLAGLPVSARPREVAIFTDCSDEGLRALRSRIKPSKVHIFVKPLHMHG